MRFLPFAFLILAACGADGPPEAPARASSGVTISGDARVGVVFNE